MPLLRKTGIRAPFLPGPLAGALAPIDALRSVVVLGTIVPSLLLGGGAAFVGRPAPPEDVNWPARPALVRGPGVPIPGAAIAWVGLPHQEPAKRGAPPLLITNQPPIPDAVFRVVGFSRAAEAGRPASPQVVTSVAPVPGAVVAQLRVPRDAVIAPAERVPFSLVDIGPSVPIPGAQALVVGFVHATPLDRLAVMRVVGATPPLPAAIAIRIFAPRDQVVAQSDRVLAGATTIGAATAPPGAATKFIGLPRTAPDRLAPVLVQVGQAPLPRAVTLPVGAAHDGDRLPVGAVVLSGQQPMPGAKSHIIGAALPAPTDRVPWLTPIVCAGQQPVPGGVIRVVGFAFETPTDRLPVALAVFVPSVPVPGAVALPTHAGYEVAVLVHARIVSLAPADRVATLDAAARTVTLVTAARIATVPEDDE